MTDPHSSDAAPPGAPSVDPERDAKIDELLLAGLEHYFAGRFQESIHVWGRVLFLDRGHARARAYIERARSAQAERQRRSDELLHRGVEAIQRGDEGRARELLESAAQGDSADMARAYLDRLDRLAASGGRADGPGAPPPVRRRTPRSLVPDGILGRTPRPVRAWPLVLLGIATGVIVVLAAASDLLRPLVEFSWRTPASAAAQTVAPEPLPVPRTATNALAAARRLRGAGHLRDALTALDVVQAADPAWVEAEALRAQIQRQLLDTARVPVPARVDGGDRSE